MSQAAAKAQLIVRVWGMNADGRAFFQNVTAHDLTAEGIHVSGLEHNLKVGDTIGVQLANQKARCRVLWVLDGGATQKTQARLELIEGQPCPWKAEIQAPTAGKASPASQGGANRRRFARHKLTFPIELRDGRSGSVMLTNATDISGCGCYIETMVPLPLGTDVKVSFWIESEKIVSNGVIKASDPGVGMGIEFSMAADMQRHIQQFLDKVDNESSGLVRPDNGTSIPSRTTY